MVQNIIIKVTLFVVAGIVGVPAGGPRAGASLLPLHHHQQAGRALQHPLRQQSVLPRAALRVRVPPQRTQSKGSPNISIIIISRAYYKRCDGTLFAAVFLSLIPICVFKHLPVLLWFG